MQERRRYVRVPEGSQISYEVVSASTAKPYITENISLGGIRFFVHNFIPKNSFLRIRITFEKMVFSFETVVKIVWIREVPLSERYEVGVEFTELSQEALEHLRDYVRIFSGR